MDKQKTPAELAQDQRDNERFGDDPAKTHRVSLGRMPLIQDEYFTEASLKDFEAPGQELKELSQARREARAAYEKDLAETAKWLQENGFPHKRGRK